MTEDSRVEGPSRAGGADDARAALDALSGISRRRDEVLDRRRLGWILLFDAIVPTVAFASWILSEGLRDASVSMRSIPTLAMLVIVILWDQLSRGLRERYRARSALRGVARTVQNVLSGVGAGILLLAMVFTLSRGEAPVALVVIGSVILISGGIWAACTMMRDARGAPRKPPADHALMNVAGRIATFFFGLGLGSIAVVGPWSAARGGFEVLAVIPAVLALLIAGVGRFVNAVPELGAMWRPPQWIAFGLSVAITCAVPVFGAARPTEGVLLGVVAGGTVLVLFGAAALWPEGADA